MRIKRLRDRYGAAFTCCAVVSSVATAAAQQDFALTESDFFAPMPTVLTASRLIQPLADAPVAMTVIDREMIQASSATRVPDLLRLVPGFQVTYTEGVEAVATYQGFADSYPERMQVMVDGRSVYNPAVNGVVWATLPLTIDDIERIEVVRGANAAAYGSNAFLGSINIITRSVETLDRAMVRTSLGSADSREAEFAHAAHSGPLAFGIRGSYAGSEGFAQKPDDNRSRILDVDAVYRPTLRDSVSFSAGVRETDFDSEAFRVPRGRTYRSHYQQLVWSHRVSDSEDVRVQLYHNAFDSPDDVTFRDPGSGLLLNVDYSLETDRYDLEVQHRLSPAEHLRLSWGGGLRRDTVSGPGVYDTDDDIDRDMVRLFANLEWHAREDLTVNVGLMGEHFSDLGDYFSPRLALNWHAAPRHTLRVSAARAYRMPTIFERRGELKLDILLTPVSPDSVEVMGTADNDAERIHSFEAGYLFEAPAISGLFDFRLFHHEVNYLIYDIQDTGLPGTPLRFDEAGSLRTTGLEAQAKFRPTRDSLVHVAYAYAEADGGYVTRIDAAGNPVATGPGNPRSPEPAVPEHTLTALVSQKLPGDWQLSGTFFYVSEMEWLGEGDYVDRQNRIDTKLSKRFRHTDGDLEFSLTVQNLFDDPYWEFTRPDPGGDVRGNLAERRIFAQVKARLY